MREQERCSQVPRLTVNGAVPSGKWADNIRSMAGSDEVQSGLDWYAVTSEREDYGGVRFVDCDFTEMRSEGSIFSGCVFRNVRFNVSTHVNSAFDNCRFEHCNFFDATFEGCKFTGSVFTGSSLKPVRVEGGNWSFVSLAGADLQRSAFSQVNFTEADFSRTDLRNTELRDCRLANISWSGARLRGADLRGSTLEGIEAEDFNVRGAVVDVAQALAIAEAHGAVIR